MEHFNLPDISPRENFLEAENVELRRSNTELQDFASTASHDLQSPLRSITHMAQLMEMDYGDKIDDEGLQNLASIIRNAKRMKLLMDNLLYFAKVSNDFPLEGKEIPARLAFDAALENLQDELSETGAVVRAENLPEGTVNSMYLIPVFQNLISNAVKYRGADIPRVNVKARDHDGHWLFQVSDNGLGIEEQYYLTIFEPFKRLHGQDIPGTGLGLALCRKIVERVGGRIWVESQPGKGSDFYFTIPKPDKLN